MPAAPNAHAEKVNKIATERRYSCEELLAQRGGVPGVGLGGGSFTALSRLRALTLSLSPPVVHWLCALSLLCGSVRASFWTASGSGGTLGSGGGCGGDYQNGKAEKPKSVYRKRVRGAEVAARGHHNGVLDLSV